MARARNPNRDKAFEIYRERKGDITNRQIAEMLGENEKVVAVWKQRDQWNVVQQSKANVVQQSKKIKKRKTKDVADPVIEHDELTEKQRLFCLYYVKTFNATQSMIKAGYAPESAHVEGHRSLRNPKVAEYIRKIKSDLASDLFLEAMDVLKKYVAIAFADITDYVKFGQREEQIVGMYGPVFEGEGESRKPVMQVVRYVELNESSMVDGSLISEVKQGRDGVSIKLADKMKALEKLSLYFDLFPEKFKRDIEEKKLEIEKEHLKLAKKARGDGDDESAQSGLKQLSDMIRFSAEVIQGDS